MSKWADTIQGIRDTITKNKDKIFSAAAQGVDADQYIALFMQAIARNGRLADCTLSSLIMGLTDSAVLGLPINSIEGDGYLVPRTRSVKNGGSWEKVWEAQFQAGYLGKLKLAYESPLVAGITTEVVREGDEFRCELGTKQEISHVPSDGAAITHIYAIMWFSSGCRRCVCWTKQQVEEHAKAYVDDKTLQSDRSAWNTSWKAMACKTVLNNLLKYAPVSDRARRVLQIEEYSDAGVSVDRSGLQSGDTVEPTDLDAAADQDEPITSEEKEQIIQQELIEQEISSWCPANAEKQSCSTVTAGHRVAQTHSPQARRRQWPLNQGRPCAR